MIERIRIERERDGEGRQKGMRSSLNTIKDLKPMEKEVSGKLMETQSAKTEWDELRRLDLTRGILKLPFFHLKHHFSRSSPSSLASSLSRVRSNSSFGQSKPDPNIKLKTLYNSIILFFFFLLTTRLIPPCFPSLPPRD